MKKIAWVILLTFFTVALFSQTKNTTEDYVNLYYEIAVRKMHEYQIPASITLAQGILESGNGNSTLATKANNHFGIKCHSDWEGEGYYMTDDAPDECFRVYANAEESFVDHSLFLTTRARYKFLFEDYDVSDYVNWAKGLKKAGYATNPNYANLLISIIEKHALFNYDKMEYIPKDSEPTDTENYIAVTPQKVYSIPSSAYYTNQEKGIYIYNRIETINSKNRLPAEIAEAYGIPYKKLLKYNDLSKGEIFNADQNVFLQPKRKRGAMKTHKVEKGQSMWEISQIYGVKLNKLYAKNLMDPTMQAAPGAIIYMKSKADKQPKTISYDELLDQKKELVKPLEMPSASTSKVVVKEQLPKENKEMVKVAPSEPVKIETTEPVVATPEPPAISEPIEIVVPSKELKTPRPNTHIVKEQETLYSISNLYYVTVEELMEFNNLKNYNLNLGQVLKLVPDATVIPEPEPTQNDRATHVIGQGDTIYRLSVKYGVPLEKLMEWNALTDYTLNIGQVLVVSP